MSKCFLGHIVWVISKLTFMVRYRVTAQQLGLWALCRPAPSTKDGFYCYKTTLLGQSVDVESIFNDQCHIVG